MPQPAIGCKPSAHFPGGMLHTVFFARPSCLEVLWANAAHGGGGGLVIGGWGFDRGQFLHTAKTGLCTPRKSLFHLFGYWELEKIEKGNNFFTNISPSEIAPPSQVAGCGRLRQAVAGCGSLWQKIHKQFHNASLPLALPR